MFEIDKNNNITLTRGDTFRAYIKIKDKRGIVYKPVNGDSIKFAAKKNIKDTKYTIEKTIPFNTMLLEILPEDTYFLPIGTKLYYDVQITFSDGTVRTFLEGEINITKEIYTG